MDNFYIFQVKCLILTFFLILCINLLVNISNYRFYWRQYFWVGTFKGSTLISPKERKIIKPDLTILIDR